MAGVLKHLATDDPAGVVYADEGRGPVLLVVHGGLSDESAWAKVAAELTPSFRVVRIRRRLYRTELPADPATDFALEVDDLLALAAELAEPVVIVGHSSGAVVALETVGAGRCSVPGLRRLRAAARAGRADRRRDRRGRGPSGARSGTTRDGAADLHHPHGRHAPSRGVAHAASWCG